MWQDLQRPRMDEIWIIWRWFVICNGQGAAGGVQRVQLHPSIFDENLDCTHQFLGLLLNCRQFCSFFCTHRFESIVGPLNAAPPSVSILLIHSAFSFSLLLHWCRITSAASWEWQNLSNTRRKFGLKERGSFFFPFMQCPAVSTQTNPVESSFSLLILWCDPYIMGIGLS